jgi:hypothetical protein
MMSTRTIAWVLGLCLLGCGQRSDVVAIDPSAHSDTTPDLVALGPIDVLGHLPHVQAVFDHTLAAGKTTVVLLPAATLDPFDVTVEVSPAAMDADLQLELRGPYAPDSKTSTFGPVLARSALLPQQTAHLRGYVPAQAVTYVALIRDAQLRAVPVTFSYLSAKAPALRFAVTGNELRGAFDDDPAAARTSWDQACLKWKQQMFALSGATNVEELDCGEPGSGLHEDWVSSRPTLTVAVPEATFDHVDKTAFGDPVDASSLDDLDQQCAAQFADGQAQFGARFLAATCVLTFAKIESKFGGPPEETYVAQPTLYVAPAP